MYDRDRDGLINLDEWKCLFCEILQGLDDCPVCPAEDNGIDVDPVEVFNEYKGDDNALTVSEFAVIYYLYCEDCTQGVDDYYLTYDLNQDAQITLSEFKCWFCEIVNGNQSGNCPDCNANSGEVDPVTIFNEFAGNDGKLDQSEFAIVYYLHAQHVSTSMTDLFAQYDKDDDNLLMLDDFKCLYCEGISGNSECPDCVPEEILDPITIFQENDTNYDEQICVDEFGAIYDLYCENCGYS